jgi:predicted ArsR family transcriptional regulator
LGISPQRRKNGEHYRPVLDDDRPLNYGGAMRLEGASVRERTHGALAVASRVRLLEVLRAADKPLDARELAMASRLHVSTVRFHLEVLARAGLVRSEPERGGRRGRPRRLYSSASGAGGATTSGHYQLLARTLAAHWAGTPDERARSAERAGYAVASEHRLGGQGASGLTAADAVGRISGLFAELGFDPDVATEGEEFELRLHACPFQDVAAEHPEVVCALHLGLLRGALAELDAPAAVRELRPFVEPHLCVARISPAERSGRERPAM